jgi:hypothetical protein
MIPPIGEVDPKLEIAVTCCRSLTQPRPTSSSKPREGSRYVAVEVHLENTGPIDYSDSPTNGAVFIDVNSHQYGTWLGSGVEPTLDGTVRISPEGEVTNIFGRVTQS